MMGYIINTIITLQKQRRAKVLILTRKVGESIMIGDSIKVKVIALDGGQIKLGFDAPNDVAIYRQELLDAVSQHNTEAAKQADVNLLGSLHKKLGKDA